MRGRTEQVYKSVAAGTITSVELWPRPHHACPFSFALATSDRAICASSLHTNLMNAPAASESALSCAGVAAD